MHCGQQDSEIFDFCVWFLPCGRAAVRCVGIPIKHKTAENGKWNNSISVDWNWDLGPGTEGPSIPIRRSSILQKTKNWIISIISHLIPVIASFFSEIFVSPAKFF